MRPLVSSTSKQSFALSDFAQLLTEDFVPRRLKLVDGAGMNSTADHTRPKRPRAHPLAISWLQWFETAGITEQVMQRLSSATEKHPLTSEQQLQLACIAHEHICPGMEQRLCLSIPDRQPYRLNLLHALAEHFNDSDSALPSRRGAYWDFRRAPHQPPMAAAPA